MCIWRYFISLSLASSVVSFIYSWLYEVVILFALTALIVYGTGSQLLLPVSLLFECEVKCQTVAFSLSAVSHILWYLLLVLCWFAALVIRFSFLWSPIPMPFVFVNTALYGVHWLVAFPAVLSHRMILTLRSFRRVISGVFIAFLCFFFSSLFIWYCVTSELIEM